MRGAKGGAKRALQQKGAGLTADQDEIAAGQETGLAAPDVDRLHYMADLIVELQSLANDMRLEVLERLLGLAHIEALRETADAERQARSSRKAV